jgi:pilus assembly protein Flp/PilA
MIGGPESTTDDQTQRDEEGASLVEYALLVALIAIVCILAVTFLGERASDKFSSVGSSLDGSASGGSPGPGVEVCNGVDDDGDTLVDESGGTTWFLDGDSDGVGGPTSTTACSAPAGYVAAGGDADDTDPSVQ